MSDEIKTISRDDLKAKMDSGESLVVLDVLSAESFAAKHIPGAINMHYEDLREKAEEILPDKDAQVAVYCASFECMASKQAAETLLDIGYTNVLEFEGGLKDWDEGGYLLEEG